MITDKKYSIPKIDSLPAELFDNYTFSDALLLLGFKYSNNRHERKFTNGNESLNVYLFDVGHQYIVLIPGAFSNDRRTIFETSEFAILEGLTPIEILAVLWREWNELYNQVSVPQELYCGQRYSEYIENLALSRPPNPYIVVERDYFRFIISKIKKEQLFFNLNDIVKISLTGEQLILHIDLKKYSIPVVRSENFSNEIISVLINDFLQKTPARFQREEVYLAMDKRGLRIENYILNANWNGPDLWEYEEYDEYLSNRLLHRSIHRW